MSNAIVPTASDLYWRYTHGELTAQDFVNGIQYVLNHGGQITNTIQNMYESLRPALNTLDAIDQAGRNALERWTQPDPGYIDLVNEHALTQRTSNALLETPNQPIQPTQPSITVTRARNADGTERPLQRRRLDFSPESNLPSSTTMDAAPEPAYVSNAVALTRTSTAASTTGQSKGTPVLNIPPSFPFKNVTTGYLTHYGAFSANDLTSSAETLNLFKIRMNTYRLPYADNTAMVNQTSYTAPNRGLSTTKVGNYTITSATGAGCETIYHRSCANHSLYTTNATAATDRADLYDTLYGAYTVTKCEWQMIIDYPYQLIANTAGTEAALNFAYNQVGPPCGRQTAKAFAHYEVSGDSVTDVNLNNNMACNVMETRFTDAYDTTAEIEPNQQQTISGVWYPGKIKHHCLNDSDIDVWTATGSVPTSNHLEHLIIQLKNSVKSNNPTTMKYSVNCYIKLRYTVQFRELAEHVMFPNTATGSSIVLTFPTDIQQTEYSM